jgi:hypothetical protein
VHRVRQRVLPVAYPGRAQDPAHGGESAQVSGVRALLQPAVQPEDAPAHAHGPQALRVHQLRQGVPPQLRPASPRAHAHGRRRAGVRADRRCVREKHVGVQPQRRPASGHQRRNVPPAAAAAAQGGVLGRPAPSGPPLPAGIPLHLVPGQTHRTPHLRAAQAVQHHHQRAAGARRGADQSAEPVPTGRCGVHVLVVPLEFGHAVVQNRNQRGRVTATDGVDHQYKTTDAAAPAGANQQHPQYSAAASPAAQAAGIHHRGHHAQVITCGAVINIGFATGTLSFAGDQHTKNEHRSKPLCALNLK